MNGLQLVTHRLQDEDSIVFANMPGYGVSVVGILIQLTIVAISIGVSLYLQSQIEDPTFDQDEEEDHSAEIREFRGIQTTVGQGVPIPLLLGGPLRVSGHMIESSTDVTFHVTPTSAPNTVVEITKDGLEEQDPPTLRNRIVISHGPIKSMALPEIDRNDIANVRGATYQFLLGGKSHSNAVGFQETASTINVGEIILNGQSHTESTTAAQGVTSFRVGIRLTRGLYQLDAQNRIVENDVTLEVEYKPAGGGVWTSLKKFAINAKLRSAFTVWVKGPELARGDYDIRVSRLKTDSVDPKIVDEFTFQDLVEVQSDRFAHPGLAQFAVSQVSQKIMGVPKLYTVVGEGQSLVRVYSDPANFSYKYTNNNAWCAAWVITHPLWGAGKHYDYATGIDVPSFLEYAAHCDDTVSSGDGGSEVRSFFAYQWTSQESLEQALNRIGRGSDAQFVEEGGKWRVVVDKARSIRWRFGPNDYVASSLQYGYMEQERQPSRFFGRFRNMRRNWEVERLPIDDDQLPDGNSFFDESLEFDEITRASQVGRQLARRIKISRERVKVCEFRTGVRALAMKPGEVFALVVPGSGQSVAGGEIVKINGDEDVLEINESVTLDPLKLYEITITHKATGRVTTKRLTQVPSYESNTVTVEDDWDDTVSIGDRYVLMELEKVEERFIATRVTFEDQLSCIVSGTLYSDNVYTNETPRIAADTTVFSDFDTERIPDAVGQLTVNARQPEDGGSNAEDVIDVDWTVPIASNQLVDRYQVYIRQTPPAATQGEDVIGLWQSAGVVEGTRFTIREGITGQTQYEIAVVAISHGGKRLAIEDASSAFVSTS